jgi:hypothetical protein
VTNVIYIYIYIYDINYLRVKAHKFPYAKYFVNIKE